MDKQIDDNYLLQLIAGMTEDDFNALTRLVQHYTPDSNQATNTGKCNINCVSKLCYLLLGAHSKCIMFGFQVLTSP
jgi:hypothetical protein